MFRDCYASFDKENSRVVIGNSRIEKVIHINGIFLRTEKIRDLQNNRTWEGEVSCWQRCPVLEPKEQPELYFDSIPIEKPLGMQPHLKTTLEFVGENGTFWCEFIVFPDIFFIFFRYFF